jgi:hypothetical protein
MTILLLANQHLIFEEQKKSGECKSVSQAHHLHPKQ